MENKLKNILNQTVTKSSSGGGGGSILVLEVEDQSYIFIWCSWRIECQSKVIVTSSDTSLPTEEFPSSNGLIGKKVPLLVGKKVKSFVLSPQYDLDIFFNDGYKLRIFCDIGHSRIDFNVNWEFNIPLEGISIEINNHFEENRGEYQ